MSLEIKYYVNFARFRAAFFRLHKFRGGIFSNLAALTENDKKLKFTLDAPP